ncbi:MAG TPA: toll/interleukin-1 receptor domain-containing protein [Thermoanaerobaculia bacterium]|nr:toll/interleukin-1 receptor domain-containing protein [Thermoanaerobaculia bacterium]
MSATEVFICYARADNTPPNRWLDRLMQQLEPLIRDEAISVWCDEELRFGDQWDDEIGRRLGQATVAVLLISPAFLASTYIANSELPVLLRRAVENGVRLIPLFLAPSVVDEVSFRWPDPKEGPGQFKLTDLHGSPPRKTLSEMSRPQQNRIFVRLAKELLLPDVDERRHARKAPAPRVVIQHLPLPSRHLIGRAEELERLDAAWANEHEHIISFVARGGEGKTNLIRHWLNQMAADGWRGADRVFATSFYSQGTKDQATNADQFLYDALHFFGAVDLSRFKSAHELAERLADIIASGRNLLVLDGLEPLQHPLHSRLKDPGLQTLISRLSAYNRGLAVITTRVPLPELAGGIATVTPEIELRPLTDEAGAALLAKLGVKGSARERRSVAKSLGGHALSIQMMGTFLKNIFKGDVTRASEVALLDQSTPERDKAWQILESYERWMDGRLFAADDDARDVVVPVGRSMLAVLRLLSLFDRPAESELISMLCAPPPIERLTEPLVGLSRVEWKMTLARLRKLKLLNEALGEHDVLDAHPLIREYFADRLATALPEAAREAHSRLLEHLQKSAPVLPDDPRFMMPLYHAVRHGCKAGRHLEAWRLYWERIVRETVAFTRRKITDQQLFLASNLTALSSFYTDSTFTQLDSPALTGEVKAQISYEAGHHLFVSGRLRDSVAPLAAAVAAEAEEQRWKFAYLNARLLREAYLFTGNLGLALQTAEECLDYAERSGDPWLGMGAWSALAQVLDFLGLDEDARTCFETAETIERTQVEDGQECLICVWGFWYGDFRSRQLHAACESDAPPPHEAFGQAIEDLTRRANVSLNIAHEKDIALDSAHAQQLLGRAEYLRACFAGDDLLESAEARLTDVVNKFRQISHQHHRTGALLDRAAVRRKLGRFPEAIADVREADQTAEVGSMTVLRIDAAIERCRIALAEDDHRAAAEAMKRIDAWTEATKHVYRRYVSTRTDWSPPVHHAPDVVQYRRRDSAIAVLRHRIAE